MTIIFQLRYMPHETIQKIAEAASTGAIGVFGGASYYFYKVAKGNAFKFGMFLINLFLAFFIGWLMGQFLPNNDFRDGLIAISGFSSFPILDVLEKKAAPYFESVIFKK